jgi:hypothetical protein
MMVVSSEVECFPMRLLVGIALLVLFSVVSVPGLATTSSSANQNVQRLYESARAQRSRVWTKDIPSMDALQTTYDCYVKYQHQPAQIEVNFNHSPAAQIDELKIDQKILSLADIGVILRNQLAEFAGEQAVSDIECGWERGFGFKKVDDAEAINPSFLDNSRPNLPDYIEMPRSRAGLPNYIDVRSGWQMFIPGVGLQRSPL